MSVDVEGIARSVTSDVLLAVRDDIWTRAWVEDFVKHAVSVVTPASEPCDGQSCAITMARPKTAALCYDRVWASSGFIPEPIRFGALTEFEIRILLTGLMVTLMHQREDEVPGFKDACSRAMAWFASGIGLEHPDVDCADCYCRAISDHLGANLGLSVTPVYGSELSCRREYVPGDYDVVVSSLADLQIVNEESLEWEQVLQFREDEEARKKYGRLIHWLDKELVGRDQAFIEEEIAQKLDDYEWAIRKHGFEWSLGCLSAIVDLPSVIGGGVSFAALFAAGHPGIGALVAGLTVGSRLAVNIVKEQLAIADAGRSEIAYVYELKRKLGDER